MGIRIRSLPHKICHFLSHLPRSSLTVFQPIQEHGSFIFADQKLFFCWNGQFYKELSSKIMLNFLYGRKIDEVLSIEPKKLFIGKDASQMIQRLVHIILFAFKGDKGRGGIIDINIGDIIRFDCKVFIVFKNQETRFLPFLITDPTDYIVKIIGRGFLENIFKIMHFLKSIF